MSDYETWPAPDYPEEPSLDDTTGQLGDEVPDSDPHEEREHVQDHARNLRMLSRVT